LDALVAPPGIHHWRELPHGARVGTGSPRRIAQLRSLRPDLECVPIRGNVETRIAKVDSGELAAIVLGCAGLLRLGFANRISYAFPPEEMVGAAGQGIVSVQCLEPQESNRELIYKLSEISDAEAAEAALKEREALAALGGGCQTPMGALWRNGKLWRF
jgi:hydroxymethylbilane synthase